MYLDTVMDCFILDIKVPESQQTVGDLQFSHFSVARLDAVSEHCLHYTAHLFTYPSHLSPRLRRFLEAIDTETERYTMSIQMPVTGDLRLTFIGRSLGVSKNGDFDIRMGDRTKLNCL